MHPVREAHAQARAGLSLRIADRITAFAGSMAFVYIHAGVFALWCVTGLFGLDPYPFNFLTMTVSLEAIFLSTFVMIGQNRQAEFAAAKADHEFDVEHAELLENSRLTREVHALTTEVRKLVDRANAS